MKKSTSLFLSFVAITATAVSCSKNDPAPASSSDAMVGHWELETYSQTYYSSTSSDAQYDPFNCTDKSFIDLKPTGVAQVGRVDENCVLTKSDGTYTDTYGVLQFEGGTRYKIISVTASKLILRFDLSSDGGQYYTYTLLKK